MSTRNHRARAPRDPLTRNPRNPRVLTTRQQHRTVAWLTHGMPLTLEEL